MSPKRQPDVCSETERAFFTQPQRYLLTRSERDAAFQKHRERIKGYHDSIGADVCRRTTTGHRRPDRTD